MKFGFVAKHRGIWAGGLDVRGARRLAGGLLCLADTAAQSTPAERGGAGRQGPGKLPGQRSNLWRQAGVARPLAISCGLHRIERLMRLQALKARPRRRRLPPDPGERQVAAVAPNVLDRSFEATAPNRKWIADFTLRVDSGRLALLRC